ncbi:transposase [Desulfobacterota bacterium AH_259_B03_O07]|nr:transposase [Desulfobacterota bacterium AH_259_B03_O07]
MPRTARIVVPNYPYHITQRGNYQQNIFVDEADRLKYVTWIKEYSKKHNLALLAYCLMDNHVHFIVIPGEEKSLSRVFSIVHMRYSQYFNKKRKLSGHLWKGRFYSCILDEVHLMAALRYVENNPVRARLVKKAWERKWGSAAHHTGRSKDFLDLEDVENMVDMGESGWDEYLESDEIEDELDRIRKHTMLERPLGTPKFFEEIDRKVGRVIKALPRRRPREKKKINSVCPYFYYF